MGIGQGELELTTVQMANLAAILANRGYFYTPHLVKSIGDSETEIPRLYTIRHEVDIDKEHFDSVIDGMELAVRAGTGTFAQIPGVSVCGKTGTSQNAGVDHSVFFAFAPKENPKIAIAVFIENAGWGGTYAAPIASLIIERYLNGEIAENRNWIVERMLNSNLLNEKS